MQEQLAAVVASLESAQARVRALGDRVSIEAWKKPRGPGQWSAADCVEHLNLTSAAYVPLLRDALAHARELRATTSSPYRRDALGWFMSMMIGPMRHIGKVKLVRVKTADPFVPKGGRSREKLLSEFVRLQSDIVAIVSKSDGLPIDRVRIVSPFGGRMKYNAYSAMVIVARHQHRHLDQAEEAAEG